MGNIIKALVKDSKKTQVKVKIYDVFHKDVNSPQTIYRCNTIRTKIPRRSFHATWEIDSKSCTWASDWDQPGQPGEEEWAEGLVPLNGNNYNTAVAVRPRHTLWVDKESRGREREPNWRAYLWKRETYLWQTVQVGVKKVEFLIRRWQTGCLYWKHWRRIPTSHHTWK